MMKKITLLFILLTLSFGYSQTTLATYSFDDASSVASWNGVADAAGADASGTNPLASIDYNATGNGTGALEISGVSDGAGKAFIFQLLDTGFDYQGAGSINISFDAKFVGPYASAAFHFLTVTSGAGATNFFDLQGQINETTWSTIDVDINGITNANTNLEISFQIAAGAVVDAGGTVLIDNIVITNPTNPLTDTTLSDLQLDGVTITGFSSPNTTYNIGVESGDSTPVVTTVTPTNGSATVGTITQASGVPGSATFDVTSEDTSVVTSYTINFFSSTPSTKAPTPPVLDAADVRSIFSDDYTPVTTMSYDGSGPPDVPNTYNTWWCPANTVAFPIDGETANRVTGLGCEGIDFQAGRFDASSFDTFHIDIWTTADTMDKSFNIILSQWNGDPGQDLTLEYSLTNASAPVSLPNPNPGTWMSFDIPLADFSNGANAALRDDIVQMVLVSNMTEIFYDNLYLYKSSALSTNDFEKTSFKIFPNPTQDSWTVKTQSASINSINVFDVLGKNVMSLSPNKNEATIDGASLNKGLYFAQIETASGISSLKLIKQ